jgi:hypothetical protein
MPMKTILAAVAATFLVATAAAAGEAPSSCAQDPAAYGMRERIEGLRQQGDRIEWTADREERRILMDLHMKKMHEGMRTLRERGAGDACRMEFMQAMLEQVTRHHLLQDPGTR